MVRGFVSLCIPAACSTSHTNQRSHETMQGFWVSGWHEVRASENTAVRTTFLNACCDVDLVECEYVWLHHGCTILTSSRPRGLCPGCACQTASLNVRPGVLKDRLLREQLQSMAADEQLHLGGLSWGVPGGRREGGDGARKV
jgi:hypothetical protein